MRTVEVLFVIIIILGAFIAATQFAVLPSPRQIFGTNLRELAVSTLQTFDAKYNLSRNVFADEDDPVWGALQKALSASLPPNIVYNLSVFSVNSAGGSVTYDLVNSISNAEGDLGVGSESASCLVTSSEVTFGITPEKIGENSGKNITLYILNCDDANGWWITGYTAQSLALDLHNMLSPYFQTTILVNSTYQLGLLLNDTALKGETLRDAVVINTFGEAVPIPNGYYRTDGYTGDGGGSYARYAWRVGQRVNSYNWTWVSIVGWPFYYVTNTGFLNNTQNGWGVYGMWKVSGYGLGCFLRGLAGWSYSYSSQSAQDVGVVYLSSTALDRCNYYGIYPAPYQTATRAIHESIRGTYGLTATEIFNRPQSPNQNWIPAATYRRTSGSGAFTAIGLTRIPDIRVSVLGLLMYYNPQIYRSEFGASGTSRLVTLQLSQQGGT